MRRSVRQEGRRVGNHRVGWVSTLLVYYVVGTGRLVHWENGSVVR